MNRRSLLKTIGACLGFGLWSKTREGEEKCCCGEELEPSEVCFYNNVCDPLPLPPGDYEKGIHNATFIRDIVPGLAWVRLTTGQDRVASTGLWGVSDSEWKYTNRSGLWGGQRLVLMGAEDFGLWIRVSFPD